METYPRARRADTNCISSRVVFAYPVFEMSGEEVSVGSVDSICGNVGL